MSSAWYLSMPVGTIFAFRLNELASLSHLRDPEVEQKLALEKTEDEIFMGYVTEVSPSGLEVGLLASEPHASPAPTSPSAHPSYQRKGIAVHTDGPTPSSFPVSRPRRSTHPAYTTPTAPSGGASSRALVSSQTPLSPFRPRGPSPPPPSTPSAENTSLRPSAPLPWERAYAFRPDPRPAPAPTSAKAAGHRHRFTVGGLTTGGTARAARARAHFFKAEVERAGKAMDKMRKEEDDFVKQSEATRFAAAAAAASVGPDVLAAEPPSSTSSDTSISTGGSSQFSDVSLSSATEHNGSKNKNNGDTSIKLPHARDGSRGAPIVIDVMFDIAGGHELPASPASFEAAVARLEKLERASRRASKEKVIEWARNAVTLI